ncbi:hypothetical protein AVEN_141811-1 [Araneus ventricosus]|uniref:Secreted protein n=1 Tax=Araneus ventricosus TaxID=182803 RepID=A0A4Y2E7K8_ARAVE|nr:hypothetical protein AVEN_141811-1 [Araneus ventricosus]
MQFFLVLVILTSRFEATRGLFWDEPRNFEPRSDDEDDTWAGSPSPNSTPHQRRDVWPLRMIWRATGPHTWRIFSGIGFRAWSPPTPKPISYH